MPSAGMPCEGCKCNFCALSSELPTRWITEGEVRETCFSCDDCQNWGGDYSKQNMWRPSCPNYIEPQKLTEHCTRMQLSKLHITKPLRHIGVAERSIE